MRALVTGNLGFVGRHLCPLLEASGYTVTGTENFCQWVLYGEERNETYDVIVHLGANIVNVHDRMLSGMKAYDDIVLDKWVCDYVEQHPPIECFIAMSSCAVDFVDDPYCIVKRTLESFATTLSHRGVPVVILRPFSGYGPDQSTEYPFRAIFERALRREDPLTVWGGSQVRDWLWIDDLCDGIMDAIKCFPRSYLPYELGTETGTSILSLAQSIADAVGYTPNVFCDESKASSSSYRVADMSYTFKKTGWMPKTSLAEGIARSVAFYRSQGRL